MAQICRELKGQGNLRRRQTDGRRKSGDDLRGNEQTGTHSPSVKVDASEICWCEATREINLPAVLRGFILARLRDFHAGFTHLNSEMLPLLEGPLPGEQQRVKFLCQI